ncbi:hypothetical protein C4D60_Mb07t05800 [Musa balbisiana]|uniref:Uncharacterized protein n=1 Tax=Musa balbisiana TaxID=52838 RepID=A0A4S8JF46_MUSBA|nr:hypothetical protein C4D60_Mb07t05800 [Musa balbisiana]
MRAAPSYLGKDGGRQRETQSAILLWRTLLTPAKEPLGFSFRPVRFPWANPLPSEGQSSCFGSSSFWGSVDSDLEVILDWSWRGFRFGRECGKGQILERFVGFLAGDGFEGSS